MTPPFTIIVPARVASTRFPGKLLHEVCGKPILLWTAERIRDQAPEFPLSFAVADEVLRQLLEAEGFHVLMTDPAHTCGTERIAEANRTLGAEYVINVQADEPLVRGAQIRQLAQLMRGDVEMATLGRPPCHEREYLNPNCVKLVCDSTGHALYFSRAPIPYFRDFQGRLEGAGDASCPVLIHVGLYAYTAEFLEAFTRLERGRLEEIEKLEMLRALEAGHRIAVGITEGVLIGIDTPEQAVEFERRVQGAAGARAGGEVEKKS